MSNVATTSANALTTVATTSTPGTALTGVTQTQGGALTNFIIATTTDTAMKPTLWQGNLFVDIPAGQHIWNQVGPSPGVPFLRDYTSSGAGVFTGGLGASYIPTQFLTSATEGSRTTGTFVTNVTSTPGIFLTDVDTTSTNAPFINTVTPTFTNVATAVTPDSSGATSTGNSLACGPDATAADGGTAVGPQATAGSNGTAIGLGTTASFAGSTAIGAGAVTTASNQVMVGTVANTYTAPGITSVASKAAQGTPTHVVTSNTGGDLAAYTPSELGLVTTADLAGFATKGDVSGLQTQINHLGQRDRELTEGLAAVVSLAQPVLLPGQHFAMRAGWGGFGGSSAVGFSAAGVLANNLLRPGFGTLVLDGGVGVGTDEGQVAGRAGVSFGW